MIFGFYLLKPLSCICSLYVFVSLYIETFSLKWGRNLFHCIHLLSSSIRSSETSKLIPNKRITPQRYDVSCLSIEHWISIKRRHLYISRSFVLIYIRTRSLNESITQIRRRWCIAKTNHVQPLSELLSTRSHRQ